MEEGMISNEVTETLIKYYECNEYSYDALKNNYLWASHPEQFNDPFDCSPKLWDECSFTTDKIRRFINFDDHPEYQKHLESRGGIIDLVQIEIGVICLNSGNKENEDLFWGYYSNQKGFAIEFSKDKLSRVFGSDPMKVNYFENDTFEKYSLPDTKEQFFEITKKWIKQKKQIWVHEDEFRYIFFNCDSLPSLNLGNSETRKKYYSPDCIAKITLGLKFFGDCLVPIEGEAFIYNLTKESNPYHYKLLRHLIDDPKYSVWWMFQNDNLSLEQIPIKLSYLDPWNIIVKVENGNTFNHFPK